jgi:hypothetical protein
MSVKEWPGRGEPLLGGDQQSVPAYCTDIRVVVNVEQTRMGEDAVDVEATAMC